MQLYSLPAFIENTYSTPHCEELIRIMPFNKSTFQTDFPLHPEAAIFKEATKIPVHIPLCSLRNRAPLCILIKSTRDSNFQWGFQIDILNRIEKRSRI
ncbi:hypothetical protein CEXT_353991 [Caerostris extrusa]|uniref:Uncharacterized protein n=1 Tax=Caerostris extrusa TaxID=172846 RepID=A0AAV4NJP3_CAEEX|nr:hypothetical protein CEXT_353991 [Caerostris extrusa]